MSATSKYTEAEILELLSEMAEECSEQRSFYGRGAVTHGGYHLASGMAAASIRDILTDSFHSVLAAREQWTPEDEAEARRDH